MSLATRCPSCGTVFRVVRDQLKVSDGWVRCGRCADVFNAEQRLFELEADGVGEPSAAVASVASVASEASEARETMPPSVDAAPAERAAATAVSEGALRPAPSAPSAPSAAAPAAMSKAGPEAEAEAESAAEAPAHSTVVTEPPSRAVFDSAVPAHAAAASAVLPPGAPADAVHDAAAPQAGEQPLAAEPTPEFIRRADRAAQRHGARRRAPLAVLSLLLLALLVGQMALHYRDRLAAEWPAMRPLLQAACAGLGCSVEAPRRIDALQVDSSGLVRVQDSALYRLSLVVRNKAPTAVRMPAVELALSDAQGLTVARRVFGAAELGQAGADIAAGSEIMLQATLDLGERRVAGYTVELFYP